MRIFTKIVYTLLFIFIYCFNGKTQVIERYENEDQSIDIEILSVDGDEGLNSAAYVGIDIGIEGPRYFGFSTYSPKKFYAKIAYDGSRSFSIDGNIFLYSKTKTGKIKQSLKSSGNTRYVFERPIIKRVSYGLHLGAFNTNIPEYLNGLQYSEKGIIAGLSILKAKHTHINVFDRYKERRGTLIGRLSFDVAYFFDQKLLNQTSSAEKVDEKLRKIGCRLYWDGKSTIWGKKGRVCFHYSFGAGVVSDKSERVRIIGGIGLGYNFNLKKVIYKPVVPLD